MPINADTLDAGVERHRPAHGGNRTDARDIGIAQRVDLVDLLDAFLHHENRRADVLERGGRPHHQPAEDRRLLDDQESREKQAGHQHEVFGGVSEEHFEGESDHAVAGPA
ncbi:MAG: hypothetical protein MUC40_03575 [Akkermansiaceae bacterium]|nr:hypothetical protein [Akkermansiaceae bacterium]